MSRKKQISARLACVLVASMVTMGIAAATPGPKAPSPRPKLVVGIFVKGLSADHIDLLRSNFGPGGFNRVIAEGLSIDNVDYGPGIDATAATAMLVTGAAPGVNGVPSGRVWNATTRTDIPVLLAPELAGSYSDRDLSPARLLVSTISDEVRISDGGLGTVHALAADPQMAVILGGHAGNSAFWISDVDGKWTSATYFKETPAVIARRNAGLTLASRLDTLAWEPALKLDRYPDLPDYKKLYPFRHTFPARNAQRFKAFKTSAPGNRELAATATDLITGIPLGKRAVTDMLSVAFDLSPYLYGRDADNRIETMDAYVRLDSQIASIIRAIDEKGPGMDSTLLFIAGTPAPSGSKRDEERWAIPTGTFSPRKAVSLLNVYLMAIHGPGEWVGGYYNGFFHLNAKLAKDRGLDMADLRRESADFLARMAGVSEVYTLDDILARRAGDNPAALERNIHAPHAGDLLVTVNPGWEISDGDDDDASLGETKLPVVRWQATTSPVYILSPDITPATVTGVVDARAIAPTVARILRIRSPNAAKLPPLKPD